MQKKSELLISKPQKADFREKINDLEFRNKENFFPNQ